MAASGAFFKGFLRVEGVVISAYCEALDGGGEGLVEIRHLGDFDFASAAAGAFFCGDEGCDIGVVAVGEAPFEAGFGAVDKHAFLIDAGGFKQGARGFAL